MQTPIKHEDSHWNRSQTAIPAPAPPSRARHPFKPLNVDNVAPQQQRAPKSGTAFIPDLEPENMAGLKSQLDELKRECNYLRHHRDVALQACATYKEARDALNMERDTLKTESAVTKTERDALKTERDVLTTERNTLRTERDALRTEGDALRVERDEGRFTLAKYNPEVINRQKDLLSEETLAAGRSAEELSDPLVSSEPDSLDPTTRMRQWLCYLGVLRGPRSYVLEGKARLDHFRAWLENRPVSQGAESWPDSYAYVFEKSRMPALSLTASRLCNAPPLFVAEFTMWCTNTFQHGIYVCPEYVYSPTPTCRKPVWARADKWDVHGEQHREVFYLHEDRIFYAGTYVCHTGPGMLKVHHLGMTDSEEIQKVFKNLVQLLHPGGLSKAEKSALRELYCEGTLTVRVLGLERVRFNNALYHVLHEEYKALQEAQQKQKSRRQKRQETRAQQAAMARPVHPAIPIVQPVSFHLLPPMPSVQLFNPATNAPLMNANCTASPYLSSLSQTREVPPHLRTWTPSQQYTPARAPSDLQYATAGPSTIGIKREREENESIYGTGGGLYPLEGHEGRHRKVPKTEEDEDARWKLVK